MLAVRISMRISAVRAQRVSIQRVSIQPTKLALLHHCIIVNYS
jgi:hypothetical protein